MGKSYEDVSIVASIDYGRWHEIGEGRWEGQTEEALGGCEQWEVRWQFYVECGVRESDSVRSVCECRRRWERQLRGGVVVWCQQWESGGSSKWSVE